MAMLQSTKLKRVSNGSIFASMEACIPSIDRQPLWLLVDFRGGIRLVFDISLSECQQYAFLSQASSEVTLKNFLVNRKLFVPDAKNAISDDDGLPRTHPLCE